MKLENVLDMCYNAVNRVRLQYMYGGEGPAEFPWEFDDELADGLAFPGGCIWFDGPRRTPRFNAAPFVPLAGDPECFFVARRVEIPVSTPGATPVLFTHNFGNWPIVQCVKTIVGITTQYVVFDVDAAGGSIKHNTFDTFTVDFGAAAFNGSVIMVG